MLEQVEKSYGEYRISEALVTLYSFIWNDFFSNYLEWIKPAYEKPIDNETLTACTEMFEKISIVLHPFMPFITEEIWHYLRERKEGEDCVISSYPSVGSFDKKAYKEVDQAIDIISKIRATRKETKMKDKEPLKLFVQKSATVEQIFQQEGIQEIIEKDIWGSIKEFLNWGFHYGEGDNSIHITIGLLLLLTVTLGSQSVTCAGTRFTYEPSH